jgi:ribosomal protein S18 acetylase RimI-like enzyme
MEMTAPPVVPALPRPIPGAEVARERLARVHYLELYRGVGEALQWDQRLRMPASALEEFLAGAAADIHILRVAGKAAGFCEMDRSALPEIEIVNFGLLPEAQGRRLGPYLLDQALRAAWRDGARRIWLHTDTNDHAKAQSVYERAGFRIYARRRESFPD